MDTVNRAWSTSVHHETDEHLVDRELARLRRVQPVSWQPGPSGGGWVVTKHADVDAALRATDVFSSEHGTTEPLYQRADPAAGSMLAVTDPPRHTAMRRAVHDAVDRHLTLELRTRVRRTVRRLVAHVVAGEMDDVVREVAHQLSVEALADLLTVPDADRHRLAQLCASAFVVDVSHGGHTRAARAVRAEANMEIIEYFVGLARMRGHRPKNDFVSALLAGGLTHRQAGLNCFNVLAGGAETTRSVIGGFLAMVAGDASLLPALRARPRISGLAVEEIIRRTSPVRRLFRVCKKDTVLGGQQVTVGQFLSLWIVSANHDEDVFEDPAAVHLDRFPNPHLGFGAGQHACLGMRMARLELRELVDEFIQQPGAAVAEPDVKAPVRLPRR